MVRDEIKIDSRPASPIPEFTEAEEYGGVQSYLTVNDGDSLEEAAPRSLSLEQSEGYYEEIKELTMDEAGDRRCSSQNCQDEDGYLMPCEFIGQVSTNPERDSGIYGGATPEILRSGPPIYESLCVPTEDA